LSEITVATDAPTPTLPKAPAQALADSVAVFSALMLIASDASIRLLSPMVALVVPFEYATANAPATPTLLPPAPARPSAVSFWAYAASVFCSEIA
jgi:hypothetical protein